MPPETNRYERHNSTRKPGQLISGQFSIYGDELKGSKGRKGSKRDAPGRIYSKTSSQPYYPQGVVEGFTGTGSGTYSCEFSMHTATTKPSSITSSATHTKVPKASLRYHYRLPSTSFSLAACSKQAGQNRHMYLKKKCKTPRNRR